MEKKKMKKIRIINADALKANIFDYAPPEMMWDRGDIEHKIDEMPISAVRTASTMNLNGCIV